MEKLATKPLQGLRDAVIRIHVRVNEDGFTSVTCTECRRIMFEGHPELFSLSLEEIISAVAVVHMH